MAGTVELGPLTEISLEGAASSGVEEGLRLMWRAGLGAIVVLLLMLAALVAFGDVYRPGDDVGYNLGLVGGLMMVSLLFYPLRKRVQSWGRFGVMAHWFRYHMVIGIGGPLLILFHSTFKVGSMNGRVALYSTLLVAGSGIIGRFVYRHIHRGLYGRRMTLAEAAQDLEASASDMRSVLGLVPQLSDRLKDFQQYANRELPGMDARIWRFVTLRWRARSVAGGAYRVAKKALKRAAREQHWNRSELRLHWKLAKGQISTYVDAVCSASQFATWERLFSLWHVVHVPFIYLLVICGVVHVVAVHMY